MAKKSGIPDWFKSENYKKRYDLTLKEWYFELRQRYIFYKSNFHEEKPGKINLALESHKPVAFLHKNKIILKGLATESVKYKSDQLLFESMPDYHDHISRSEFTDNSRCYDFHDIRINLSRPYYELTNDFINYINCKKQIGESSPTIKYKKLAMKTESDCYNWAYSGLLQYLDLSRWAEIEGVNISNDILGINIYGTDIDHGSKELPNQGRGISQTTSNKYANHLNQIINELNNQLFKRSLIELPKS